MEESSSTCPRGARGARTRHTHATHTGRSVTRVSLLESLQSVIERTYDLETGVGDIGRFVIGDAGYRALYGGMEQQGRIIRRVAEPVGSAFAHGDAPGARTLLREAGSRLAVCIYYPDSLVSCLERHDPTRGLDDRNVDAFAVLVEELDHFLMIAERWRRGAEMSLLDLELHANVTKYLVLKLFVARMRRLSRLPAADKAWIRFHLFEKGNYVDPDPAVRQRYRDAARLAALYASALDAMPRAERLSELRRFHRLSPQGKQCRIASLS
jgi:hypothetical protein